VAFPHIPADKLGDDLAYPAMLTFLPTGMIGVVLASLIAAVMSTLSTHLNWGSSYVVNDFYLRFLKPEASDKELVAVGRISTVVLMVLSSFLALALSSALSAFAILLQIGAGTGLIFILRWFWWRINAYTEISAMIISFAVAIFFELINPTLGWVDIPEGQSYLKLVYSVSITTVGWLLVTFLTQPEKDEVLLSFYRKVQPASLGWKKVLDRYPAEKQEKGRLGMEIGLMLVARSWCMQPCFPPDFLSMEKSSKG
jgi:Na+/proline symporter